MSEPSGQESIDFILANIGHLHRVRIHQRVEALGLHQGQPPLLRELWKQEGLTQTELAARMKITTATVTKMLQRMEKAGFIQRKADSSDQRISRVYLTDSGFAVRVELEKVFKSLEEETFANLGPDDLLQLRSYLLQIRENLLNVTGEEPWK